MFPYRQKVWTVLVLVLGMMFIYAVDPTAQLNNWVRVLGFAVNLITAYVLAIILLRDYELRE